MKTLQPFLWLFVLAQLSCGLLQIQAPTPSSAPAVSPTISPATSAPQVLRLVGGEPETIDPQQVSNRSTVMMVFSNLLTYDSDARLVPEMAQDLPSVSADGLTYTFTVRTGLKYSDGVPLTARNFEYGWKRQFDPAIASRYAFTGCVIRGGLF